MPPFHLISRLYERVSPIVTTNYDSCRFKQCS